MSEIKKYTIITKVGLYKDSPAFCIQLLRHPLLNQFWDYSFGITILELQFWDYSFGITVLGLQYEHPDNCLHLSYSRRCITASPAESILGLQFWSYSFGITILELQFWDYNFGITV